jgi:hypothetical protein
MIINIFREEHLPLVQELPREVKEVIKENIKILEENYGTERTVEDLGGYIAVVGEDDIETFKKKILKNTVAEYIDEINCNNGAEYISALFLCGSDFSIVVVCEKKLSEIIEQ